MSKPKVDEGLYHQNDCKIKLDPLLRDILPAPQHFFLQETKTLSSPITHSPHLSAKYKTL